MSNPGRDYIRRQENKEICQQEARKQRDSMVQTEKVFFMTEKEQTMLYLIRIFNIDIVNLSNLCYGAVCNYSSRRYTVDTEPILSDSEDEESSQIMEALDETTVNKLIEESQKNKELIYNLMNKADKNMHQSIKERNKQITSTTIVEETKKTKSIGINTIDPRNIILNKWAKDNNQCREPSSCSNRNQNQSKVQVTNVKILLPKNSLDQKHQHQSTTPTTPLCNLLPDQKREMQIYYEDLMSSHMPLLDKDSQSIQDNISSNEQDDSTQETVTVSHTVLLHDSNTTITPGSKTPHLESVNSEIKETEQTDLTSKPTEQEPIPLLQKVPETLGINDHRPKLLCNPSPDREYKSPFIKNSYPMLSYNEIKFYEENYMHFISHIDCNNLSEIQQQQEQQNHEQHLQLQQILENLTRQEMKINYLCYRIDSLHKQALGHQQAPVLQSPLPSPSSKEDPVRANLMQNTALENTGKDSVPRKRPYTRRNNFRQARNNPIKPSNHHLRIPENVAPPYYYNMRPHDVHRWPYHPDPPHNTAPVMNTPCRMPHAPNMYGPHGMHMSSGKQNNAPKTQGQQVAQRNVPTAQRQHGQQSNELITDKTHGSHGAQSSESIIQELLEAQRNVSVTQGLRGTHTKDSMAQKLHEAQNNVRTQWLHGTQSNESLAQKLYKTQSHVPTMQGLHRAQSNAPVTQGPHGTQFHGPVAQVPQVSTQQTASMPQQWQEAAAETSGWPQRYSSYDVFRSQFEKYQ